MKRLSILATSVAAFATPALAQDSFVLPTITLTANREATELSRSGSSVSVLTRGELEDRASQPLADTLSRLPGINWRQSGPLGTTGSIQLRGAPSQYLPVIIDGIDVSDPAAGQPYYDIGGLTSSGINRVELLRGAQSALYGSRAVAGVLSLQTLRPTQDGLQQEFAIEAGSYGTLQASYGVTLRRDNTDLAFQASRIITDGFSASDENDGNTEDDGYDATRLTFYAAHELQSGATIGVNAFWEESRADFDDGFYDFATGTYYFGDRYGTPGDDYTDKESYGIRAFANFSTGAIDHEVAATRYQLDRSSWSNGYETPFKGTRTKLSWQGATDIGTQGTRAVFGADTEKEEAKGNGDARLTGVFGELNIPVGEAIDINASLRHDDHSQFGGYTSGRLAAVYRASEDLLFRAAIGNGFRAPSLYELYSAYGNADLKREDSRTAEIGVEKLWGEESYLRATAFWMEADNLIGWDQDSMSCAAATGPFGLPGCYAQIDGSASRSGLEVDGRYGLGNHAFTAAYTYTDNRQTSEWAKVPEHVLNLGFETRFATETTAGIQLLHVANRPDGLDDFTTVDLTLRQALPRNVEAYLRLENILDEQYQLNDGYGTSDRAAYVGIRAAF
ncbi:TonB-dependent receptor [Paracoccus sp. Z330]|uniref:TonB-dependent receptor n=1 Tax=Paracoccus onchidii TaxID=3017813 RepID=A0ABT4Z9L5_9RHOB|nr:TonB-dependent receptor [Paracoccus onchidii]MDB6176035.1 TonB-dependent receptor [Paracoccus onchidii]